jgi:hypothetical protein
MTEENEDISFKIVIGTEQSIEEVTRLIYKGWKVFRSGMNDTGYVRGQNHWVHMIKDRDFKA